MAVLVGRIFIEATRSLRLPRGVPLIVCLLHLAVLGIRACSAVINIDPAQVSTNALIAALFPWIVLIRVSIVRCYEFVGC